MRALWRGDHVGGVLHHPILGGAQYTLPSDQPLELQADLTVSDIGWQAETYANGHNFTAGENVYQSAYAFYGRQYNTTVTGELSLTVVGSPGLPLYGSGFTAVQYGGAEDTWSTLDLTQAGADFDGFAAFSTVRGCPDRNFGPGSL